MLTDDIVKVSNKRCECGRKGKTFEILGRVKEAEIRGCGDAYQREIGGVKTKELKKRALVSLIVVISILDKVSREIIMGISK